jgi:hypothetical protein
MADMRAAPDTYHPTISSAYSFCMFVILVAREIVMAVTVGDIRTGA